MTPHDHRIYVPGCYRCEVSRAELVDSLGDAETGLRLAVELATITLDENKKLRAVRAELADEIERLVPGAQVMRPDDSRWFVVT